MKKLILLSLALGLLPSANAGHSLGSEITYKQIDSLKYIVSITKYRICSGTHCARENCIQTTHDTRGRCVIATLNIHMCVWITRMAYFGRFRKFYYLGF